MTPPIATRPPHQSYSEKNTASDQSLNLLLKVESDARSANTLQELQFIIANESLKLLRCDQIFVLSGKSEHYKANAVSGISIVDRNSSRIQWVEKIVKSLGKDGGLGETKEFVLPGYADPAAPDTQEYPFKSLLWVPFCLRDGHVFGGMLLAQKQPWSSADIVIAKRLSGAYQHAWSSLAGSARLKRPPVLKKILGISAAVFLIGCFIPVPMTVIAPVEVRSKTFEVITAPLNGVVASVDVSPNDEVSQGQNLLRLVDTNLRNELAVAEEELRVTQARLKQVTQLAVNDVKARGELAIVRSETSLAQAKRNYALELLQRSTLTSPVAGVVLFSDKQELIGRPVSTGERLMEVADPGQVHLRIDVPVADVLAIKPGGSIRAYLDSSPLHPFNGIVTDVSFEAREIGRDKLAYRIYARFEDDAAIPKLGVRGTAQLFGDKVPLAYYLFRRPLTVLRQRFGF